MNNATPQPTAALDAGLANLREYGYTIHPGFIDGHRLVQLRERLLEQADMGEVDEETRPVVEKARAAIAKALGQ